jgi:hypothetical protein
MRTVPTKELIRFAVTMRNVPMFPIEKEAFPALGIDDSDDLRRNYFDLDELQCKRPK